MSNSKNDVDHKD